MEKKKGQTQNSNLVNPFTKEIYWKPISFSTETNTVYKYIILETF